MSLAARTAMMFESLSMMIPLDAWIAAMACSPRLGPRNPGPGPVAAPRAEPGQPPGTLQRHAIHHQRKGSQMLMWPLWTDLVLRNMVVPHVRLKGPATAGCSRTTPSGWCGTAPIVAKFPGIEVCNHPDDLREVDVNLRGARFVRSDLSGTVMRGAAAGRIRAAQRGCCGTEALGDVKGRPRSCGRT